MRPALFIKPDLRLFFAAMPPIGMWLFAEYQKAKTREDLAALFHKWIEEAETTENTTRQWCYTAAAYYIYSYLTNRSYESRLKIGLL